MADSEDFFYRVANVMPSPKNLGDTDPIVQLNKTIRRLGARRKHQVINTTELAALVIKAWNAYRDGSEIYQLRWRSGGNAPEAFPVMK